MKTDRASPSKPKIPRGRRGKVTASSKLNPPTTEQFEQEEMGLAPKE